MINVEQLVENISKFCVKWQYLKDVYPSGYRYILLNLNEPESISGNLYVKEWSEHYQDYCGVEYGHKPVSKLKDNLTWHISNKHTWIPLDRFQYHLKERTIINQLTFDMAATVNPDGCLNMQWLRDKSSEWRSIKYDYPSGYKYILVGPYGLIVKGKLLRIWGINGSICNIYQWIEEKKDYFIIGKGYKIKLEIQNYGSRMDDNRLWKPWNNPIEKID